MRRSLSCPILLLAAVLLLGVVIATAGGTASVRAQEPKPPLPAATPDLRLPPVPTRAPTNVAPAPVKPAASGAAAAAAPSTATSVPPANDNFANRAYANLDPSFSTTLSTSEAMTEVNEFAPCGSAIGKTVWYEFTPASDGLFTVDTIGSNFDTVLAVYRGPDFPYFNNQTHVACNDDTFGLLSQVSFNAFAGVTYRIQVGGYNNASGNLTVDGYRATPPNDSQFSPEVVPGVPYSSGLRSNHDASVGGAEQTYPCGLFPTGLTIWFAFTPSVGGFYTLDTIGSAISDTTLYMYGGPFSEEFCDDDSGPGLHSSLTAYLNGGYTYNIQLGGYNGQAGFPQLNINTQCRDGDYEFIETSCASLSGLWHYDSYGVPNGMDAYILSYNQGCSQPNTTLGCTYFTGGTTVGTAETYFTPRLVPQVLRFETARFVEPDACTYSVDVSVVEIHDVFSGWYWADWTHASISPGSQYLSINGQICGDSFDSQTVSVPIPAYVDGVRFYFNSVGGFLNDYPGWMLDNLVVTFPDGDVDGTVDALDNCNGYYNPSQQNTDAEAGWPWLPDNPSNPEANTLGGDACDPNDDNNGCGDVIEPALAPPRNPLNPWDFADVPTPALPDTGVRSGAIGITDVLAVISWSGALNDSGPNSGGYDYDDDANLNGIEDGVEYDRSATAVVGVSGPPSGGVSIIDALVVLAQVGDDCTP